jgi:hypothetical protein
MTNKIEIQEHGVMMSEYFHGTSGVWLDVYVDNTTTLNEVMQELRNEIEVLWDHIEYTAQYHDFEGDLEEQIEECLKKMNDYIADRKEQIYKPDLDFCYDDLSENEMDMNEYPVAIFTIEFTEE